MDKKNALRAGSVAAGTTLMMLLLSSPALAFSDDGEDPGQGLSVMETVGLFVAAPVGLFLLIVGLVMVLDKSRKQT
ncbi:hypothetical protein ACFO9E_17615 [Streptomyces maoxianensis]|uniref:Secreted protein n=1 Tax=Streptomyces maoxianensis TaxID=1459942 RepID=A0ABV9G939_9ACTN|nr:hypothetical protein [Streptomyces sp. ISL-1]MBT2393467.1 hypothetical protein [Streptomyces sp. ISL-1]